MENRAEVVNCTVTSPTRECVPQGLVVVNLKSIACADGSQIRGFDPQTPQIYFRAFHVIRRIFATKSSLNSTPLSAAST